MTTEQRYNQELQNSPSKISKLYKVNRWNVFKRDVEFEGDIVADFVATKKHKFPDYTDFGINSYRFESEPSVLSFCTHSSENPLRYLLEQVYVDREVPIDENIYCTREKDDPIIKRMMKSNVEGNCALLKIGVMLCVVSSMNIPKGTKLLLMQPNTK